MDFYFVRLGKYAITEIFNPSGIYGRWAWRGPTSYTVGLLAMVPFMSVTFCTGPVALWLNDTDLSFIVGLAVAGGRYYYLFNRGVDRTRENAIVEKTRAELAELVDAGLARSAEQAGPER